MSNCLSDFETFKNIQNHELWDSIVELYYSRVNGSVAESFFPPRFLLNYLASRKSVVLLLVTGLCPTKNSLCGQRNEVLKFNKLNLFYRSFAMIWNITYNALDILLKMTKYYNKYIQYNIHLYWSFKKPIIEFSIIGFY